MTPSNTPSDLAHAEVAVLSALFDERTPWLIGVRHHSPTLAAAMPALLAAADPQVVAVELPTELEPWIPFLAASDAKAPLAISAASSRGERLSFHPFADFSPELVAMRWANDNDRRVVAIDLPVVLRAADGFPRARSSNRSYPILQSLLAQAGVTDTEELWDRMVEVHAVGADPEAIRRSGLGYGWALRVDAALSGGVDAIDLLREEWMRNQLAELTAEAESAADGSGGVVAVVGSFHAAALLQDPVHWQSPGIELPDRRDIAIPDPASPDPDASVVTAMIPYNFEMLDSRSGYPAGIRDPAWQQRIVAAAGSVEAVEAAVAEFSVAMTSALRDLDHPAGVPDSREATRVALDLSRLRNLPAPGRRELIESLTLTLAQGEPLGRGRAVARAAQQVLVGRYNGRRPAGAPRSGLGLKVEAELRELDLPHEGAESLSDDRRLDPLRSSRDRRRHLLLQRLAVAGVTYGKPATGHGPGGVATITHRWRLHWTPTSAATVEMAGLTGSTPVAAAIGALRLRERQLRTSEDWNPHHQLTMIEQSIDAGLRSLVVEQLDLVASEVLPRASMAELIRLHGLTQVAAAGTNPGLIDDEGSANPVDVSVGPSEILLFATSQVEGLAGSENAVDARAIIDLAHLHRDDPRAAGSLRLAATLRDFEQHGHPYMAGAALAARMALDDLDDDVLAERLSSWFDWATDDTPARLRGLLAGGDGPLSSRGDILTALTDRVRSWDDPDFIGRLPTLRDGFEGLSPAGRRRLADALFELLPEHENPQAADGSAIALRRSPQALQQFAEADLIARTAVVELLGALPGLTADPVASRPEELPDGIERAADSTAGTPHHISIVDRWRLLLGQTGDNMTSAARPFAAALDELYGRGHGEGSGPSPLGRGRDGGQERSSPTARHWSETLEGLFGAKVRDEVLGRAIAAGRIDVVLELDPEDVTPSVDLLRSVLSLKGAMPEAKLTQMRSLVARVVAALTEELAVQIRPALTGLTTPRPTRRPTGSLDLRRTVNANLATVRTDADGNQSIIAEELIFRSKSQRSMDWHLTLCVDVSGSMETSTIYAAMTAAILAGVPALSVQFLTFSTEVIDLSDMVDDPLALLMEVSVGGGTNIGQCVRYARSQLQVPHRSIVVVLSDFYEGGSTERLVAEVRSLIDTGATVLGLAALDDHGAPSYHSSTAQMLADAGMPVAALSPLELASWVGDQVRGRSRPGANPITRSR